MLAVPLRMSALPLDGRRILITRAAHQAGKLSDGLRALGAVPVEVPVLEIGPPANFAPLDSALREIETFDWLILTSANAVRAVIERAPGLGNTLRGSSPPQVAVVGAATRSEAKKHGLRVDLTPEEYVAESLVASLAPVIAGRRVLLARAEVARDVIPDALRAAGGVVVVVDAYRNVIPQDAPEQLRRALSAGLDAATFTSSSSVTHLADAAKAAGVTFPFAGVSAVSIGPITSATLRDLGWEPVAEANPHDIPGLIAAVAKRLSRH
jgi:uroporphyrinogen-III synthase